MTEIQPPADPYKLLDGHWPAESSEEFRAAGHHVDGHMVIHTDQAGQAVTNAGQVADDFLGLSGGKLGERMHVDASALRSHGGTAEFLGGKLLEAANAIKDAKKDITKLVTSGTSAIGDAKPSEKLGLITQYRDKIAAAAAGLREKLTALGDEMERGEEGVTRGSQGAQTYMTPVRSVDMTPEQRQQTPPHGDVTTIYDSKPPAVQPPTSSTAPLPGQPPTPGAPQPGAPGAPQPGAPSAPPAPANPASSGGGAGQGGGGQQGGSGQGGDQQGGGQGGGNQQQQNNNPAQPNQSTTGDSGQQQQPSPLSDLGFAPPPITQLTGALAQPTANAVTNAVNPAVNPAASQVLPQSSISSVAPAGTGSTPGASMPPAAAGGGMSGGGGLGAPSTAAAAPGGPTTTAPLSPDAKLVSASQPQLAGDKEAKPTRSNPALITPVPTSSGIPVSAAALAGAAATAVLIDPDSVEPQSMACTFLQRHSAPKIVAHIVLAPLRAQFTEAGWVDCPMAVGVFRTATGHLRAVYVTVDAISLWPVGVRLPSQVIPLTRTDDFNHGAASRLAGSIDLHAKLTELVPSSFGTLEYILTSDEQTVRQAAEIIKSGDGYPVSQERSSHSEIPADRALIEVNDFLVRVELTADRVPNIAATRNELIHTRWGDPMKPCKLGRYNSVLALYLLRESLDALRRQQHAEAGFSIGELLDTLRVNA